MLFRQAIFALFAIQLTGSIQVIQAVSAAHPDMNPVKAPKDFTPSSGVLSVRSRQQEDDDDAVQDLEQPRHDVEERMESQGMHLEVDIATGGHGATSVDDCENEVYEHSPAGMPDLDILQGVPDLSSLPDSRPFTNISHSGTMTPVIPQGDAEHLVQDFPPLHPGDDAVPCPAQTSTVTVTVTKQRPKTSVSAPPALTTSVPSKPTPTRMVSETSLKSESQHVVTLHSTVTIQTVTTQTHTKFTTIVKVPHRPGTVHHSAPSSTPASTSTKSYESFTCPLQSSSGTSWSPFSTESSMSPSWSSASTRSSTSSFSSSSSTKSSSSSSTRSTSSAPKIKASPSTSSNKPPASKQTASSAQLSGFHAQVHDAHNSWRAKYGASALDWDENLASKAAAWAKQCKFEHK